MKTKRAVLVGVALVVLVVSVGTQACTSVDAINGATVRDSAGVRIVEYAEGPSPTRAIEFGADPVYRHGAADGDYQFERIWLGALQPDGGAVVVDLGNQELVLIGPDGSFRSVLARSGPDPEDISRTVLGLVVPGQDTVLIRDTGRGRLMWFADGALWRSVSTLGGQLPRDLMLHGVDDEGRPLMATRAFEGRLERSWTEGHMVRFDADRGAVDTVSSFDLIPQTPADRSYNPLAPVGVARVSGDLFIRGRTDVPEIVWHGPDGEVRQIVRWTAERSYPTDADWDTFEANFRAEQPRVNPRLSPEVLAGLIDDFLGRYAVSPGEPLPVFGELQVDHEGGVWLPEYVAGTNPDYSRYSVVNARGEWLGTVQVPPGLHVLDVSRGLVLGLTRDALGQESLAVYPISVR